MTETPFNIEKLRKLYEQALELGAEDRAAFLAELPDEYQDLRSHLEWMLNNEDNFSLDDKTLATLPASQRLQEGQNKLATPEVIGAYRILHEIGRGGMGVVYVATRIDRSFGGRVAIKVVKRGMDTDDAIRRFERERRVLSGLQHPNIARLLDGGETDDGRAFFVMEYVDGIPIDQYCDSNNLSISARLDLFAKICDAVQYAHTNLIVHRDLKPLNILVNTEGEPKLLDFGIAKILNPNITDVDFATEHGRGGPLTPEYASPEQVRGEPLTTRSDVYSLGVLLYELLCGQRPFQFKKRWEADFKQVVSEYLPERPSTLLAKLRKEDGPETIQRLAQLRGTRPDPMMKQLAGELDDIIMHALEKPPDRRYGSAGAFGEDVRRFLRGETVEARRPANRHIYRLRKYYQRNRAGVIGAVVTILVVISSISVVVVQNWNREIERRKNAEIREAQQKSLNQALSEARRAAGYSEILWNELVQISDFNRRMTVDQRQEFYSNILSRFEEVDAESRPGDSALLRKAEILTQLANSLFSIRGSSSLEIDQAKVLLVEAVETIKQVEGQTQTNLEVAVPLVNALRPLADVYEANGNLKQATELRYEIIEISSKISKNEDLDPRRQLTIKRLISAMNRKIAESKAQMCDIDGALIGFEECLKITADLRKDYPEHESVLRDWSVVRANYVQLLVEQERAVEAESTMDQVLQVRRLLHEKSPYDARQIRDLATAHYQASLVDIQLENNATAETNLAKAIELIESGLVEQRGEDERMLENWIQFSFTLAKHFQKNGNTELAESLAKDIANRAEQLRDGKPSIGEAVRHRLMPIRIRIILDAVKNDTSSIAQQLQLQSRILAEIPDTLTTAELRVNMASEVIHAAPNLETAWKEVFKNQGLDAMNELDQAGLGCQVSDLTRSVFE